MKKVTQPLLTLIGALFISFLPGIIGGYFTVQSVAEWYPFLTKPPLTPPNTVFGPVWSILYALIGFSLFLYLQDTPASKKKIHVTLLFLAQLTLNALWSIGFFGQQNPLLGLIIILPLLAFIVLIIMYFHQDSRRAAMLLIPYLLWTCFATYLNAGIYFLN